MTEKTPKRIEGLRIPEWNIYVGDSPARRQALLVAAAEVTSGKTIVAYVPPDTTKFVPGVSSESRPVGNGLQLEQRKSNKRSKV